MRMARPKSTKILVKATRPGVYGRLRETGEEFEIEDEKELGSWMDVLKGAKSEEEAIAE